MARIHIDDLPPAEALTPEQEELLLGAGLRSFRPMLEGLETREVMSANLGSTLVAPPPAQTGPALFSELTRLPAANAQAGDTRVATARAEVLRLVNLERTSRGLAALTGDWTLATVAQSHSEDMARTGVTDHNIGKGDMGTRVTAAGYNWTAVGENVSSGVTPAQAVQGWMNSTRGHRENILGQPYTWANGVTTQNDYTHVGIGVAYNSAGVAYYTVVFARPA
jgi:uncharacterized protein YkwD